MKKILLSFCCFLLLTLPVISMAVCDSNVIWGIGYYCCKNDKCAEINSDLQVCSNRQNIPASLEDSLVKAQQFCAGPGEAVRIKMFSNKAGSGAMFQSLNIVKECYTNNNGGTYKWGVNGNVIDICFVEGSTCDGVRKEHCVFNRCDNIHDENCGR